MSDTPPTLSPEDKIKLWAKYEDVAMHFNDLIMRLRTQALGGVTAIIALSGIAMNFSAGPTTPEQYDVLFGTLIFLAIAWAGVYTLDAGYYQKLLLGAVDALLELEKGSSIQLSTFIDAKFGPRQVETLWDIRHWVGRRWVHVFYGIGLVALISAAATTKLVSHQAGVSAKPPQALKVNIDRAHGDKLDLKVEPKP